MSHPLSLSGHREGGEGAPLGGTGGEPLIVGPGKGLDGKGLDVTVSPLSPCCHQMRTACPGMPAT